MKMIINTFFSFLQVATRSSSWFCVHILTFFFHNLSLTSAVPMTRHDGTEIIYVAEFLMTPPPPLLILTL